MDQIKIGKFIAERRKEQKLTQAQLAEELSITDRAVSKWETGKSMPDSSIMLELCEILKISVNELLSGEVIPMENYSKMAEENLMTLKQMEENSNKKLLLMENVIGCTLTIASVVMVFAAALAVESIIWRVLLIVVASLIFITGIWFALKLEREAGYYECGCCNHRYMPKMSSVIFAMHVGRTRYLKCPECGKKSWSKKVLTK